MVFFKSFKPHTITILEQENDTIEKGTTLTVRTPLVGRFALKPLHSDPPYHHLQEWSRISSCELSSLGYNQNKEISSMSNVLILHSALHEQVKKPEQFSLLGHRMHAKGTKWGNSFKIPDLSYTDGYWEWSEDIMGRHATFLKEKKLYGAIFASLFTYDRPGPVLKAFLESWCSSTNTLHCSIGELSISLRDLYVIGGLPFSGKQYEEVIPSVKELSDLDKDGKPFLPPYCRYLFSAFHYLCKQHTKEQTVKISDWVKFWFRGPRKYEKSKRKTSKNKTQRPKQTHKHPSGAITTIHTWTLQGEEVFTDLGIEQGMKRKTYLAAFVACWLCKFALPSSPEDMIRPGVFKVASMIADGDRFCLSVPVLASIYKGLNDVVSSSTPWNSVVTFPIHYVYGWLAEYFNTHFISPKHDYIPQMIQYEGEGSAKHFEDLEAQNLFRFYEDAKLSHLSKTFEPERLFADEGQQNLSIFEYFASLRSSYLTLCQGNHFIIEPYSPHRFSRQFHFPQDVPGRLKKDIRTGKLEEVMKLWRLSTCFNSGCKVLLPSSSNLQNFGVTKAYAEWWTKVYVDPFTQEETTSKHPKRTMSPPEKPTKIRKVLIKGLKSSLPSKPTPKATIKSHNNCDVVGGSSSHQTAEDVPPLINNRRRRQLTMDSDEDVQTCNEDRNWKHVTDKVRPDRVQECVATSLDRFFTGVPSSSQPIQTKGNEGFLGEDVIFDDNPTCSEESIYGPSALALATAIGKGTEVSLQRSNATQHSDVLRVAEVTSQPMAVAENVGTNHGAIPSLPIRKQGPPLYCIAPSKMSIFNAEEIVLDAHRRAALFVIDVIKSIIRDTPTDKILSRAPKLQTLYEGLTKIPGDYSALKRRIDSYMNNTANFVATSSSYACMMTSDSQSQRLASIDTQLTSAKSMEDDGAKRLQSLRSSLSEAEVKEARLVKELQQAREETQGLKVLISTTDEQLSRKKEAVTKLWEDRKLVEEANIISTQDLEVVQQLEEILWQERDEIVAMDF